MGYKYDTKFYDYVFSLSSRSAERVVRLFTGVLEIRSVLDIGCAEGVWLAAWSRSGVTDIQGVDGDYVRQERLLIPADRFRAHDLSEGLDLGRRFDLVQTLEVAEHLPEAAAAGFVETLVRHGNKILFSAAPPGQGGENHVNEQPYAFWRGLFARHGFVAFDWIRPQLAGDETVPPWYRYNLILYVHESELAGLPIPIRETLVPAGIPIPDIAPLRYRLRRAVIRGLPFWAMQVLAKARARLRG